LKERKNWVIFKYLAKFDLLGSLIEEGEKPVVVLYAEELQNVPVKEGEKKSQGKKKKSELEVKSVGKSEDVLERSSVL
jgi:hypothetical protein